MTATVRTYQGANRLSERSLTGRVPVVNERNSPFGAGWTLAGYQRMQNQGDGVFITEGGVGLWFERLGACGTDGICRYTSPAGDFSTMTYNGYTFDRRYPDGTVVRFEHDGRMLDHRDRFGNLAVYGYDASGRLTSIKDPAGKITTLGYTGAGALAWVQDPAGRRVTNESYNNALYHFRHPDGTLALDLHLVQDATGAWVLDTYWTEAAPRTSGWDMGTQFGYDAHGRVAAVTAPKVQVTEEGVGAGVQVRPVVRTRSLEMAVLAPAGTGGVSNPAPRVRPEAVRVEATDARGDTTKMALDPLGQPTRIEEPLGRLTVLTRDRFGRVVRTRAPSGHMARAEYRGMDLRLTQDLTTEATVEMEYEPTFHQLTRAWGTGATEVVNTYDTNDPQRKLLRSRTGPPGAPETLYTFDARGRVKSATDPEGHGTFYDYYPESASSAASGNVHTVRTGTVGGSSFRTTTMGYDEHGRQVASTTPADETTRTVYDARNRVRHSVNPLGDTTHYEYHSGHLYRVRDAKGQYYHFHNDAMSRVASEVDPRGQYTYYGYDRAGNLTWSKNRRGQEITAGYDELNRQRTRMADGLQTTWSYDPNDRWMEASNAESTNRLEFDVAGRPSRSLTTMGGTTYTQVFTPDAQGRQKQMDLSAPWGSRTIGYTYNARDQLETLRDLSGGSTTFVYNDDGQEESRTLPSGLVVGRDYPSTHVTAAISYTNATVQDLLGRGYHQNANGLIDAARMHHPDAQFAGKERVRRFAYDPRGWLGGFSDEIYQSEQTGSCPNPTAVEQNNGICVPGTAEATSVLGGPTYTYDKVGNRTDANRGASVDLGNRLTAFDSYTLQYDAEGNLIEKLRPGYDHLVPSWNSLGQMTGAWRYQKGTVSYGYDAFGRRVRRTAPDGNVTRYLYDGDDLLMELDGAGNPIREYTYYPGVDRPHSVRSWSNGGAVYYYATDNPGHVVGLVDGANQVVNRYYYTPWGEPESVSETVAQPLRYMAREYDEVTGLYQVRARWYDAQYGRFVSEDPIGLAGGINPYRYAGNDPINKMDPFGECELWAEWITLRDDKGKVTGVYILRTFWHGDDCEDGGRGGGGGNGSSNTKPTDCEIMAGIADIIGKVVKDPADFTRSFARNVAGVSSLANLRNGGRNRLPEGSRGGFRSEFGGDAGGQARHFAGAFYGAFVIRNPVPFYAYSWYRERDDPGGREDDALSRKAFELNTWLNGGIFRNMPSKTAGNWIRANVCQ